MAVARLLHSNGAGVTLWEYSPADYKVLMKYRGHPDKLKNLRLDDTIDLTNSLRDAIAQADLVVLAVPSQHLRDVLIELNKYNPKAQGYVNLAKGIETGSLKRMSEIIDEVLGVSQDRIVSVSGPSHAEEVVQDMPTAVVAAGGSPDLISHIQSLFSNLSFRVYQSDDLIGVELGGALKNIIAIAAGIAAGIGTGDNTLGALITRGLAEISRLGAAMGADPLTFSGLSGIGDLVTTCSSRHSRNRHVGFKIGQGEKLNDILAGMTMVAEGVQTTRSGFALARKHDVEMPIAREVHNVLFDDKSPADAMGDLMGRTLKAEIWQ